MSNNRITKILVWNIRGLNSQGKWDALRTKIAESGCHILCLQETKREYFDIFYLKKFSPRSLDKFAFFPSAGASGGLIIVWNGNFFLMVRLCRPICMLLLVTSPGSLTASHSFYLTFMVHLVLKRKWLLSHGL